MKIQLALDRMSIKQAIDLAQKTESDIDIIEIGTSLIKDYGLDSIRRMRAAFPEKTILADFKTMDEGEYEFRAAFNSGADIATVMGVASWSTLEACYRTARAFGRGLMIDLMETPQERVLKLLSFTEAIFCFHTPTDTTKNEIDGRLYKVFTDFGGIRRLALAGGIGLDDLGRFKAFPVEVLVIGSAITRAGNPVEAARMFNHAVGDREV